jgi:hypothetical protein
MRYEVFKRRFELMLGVTPQLLWYSRHFRAHPTQFVHRTGAHFREHLVALLSTPEAY